MLAKNEKADVVIVGSGLAGLACALYIAERQPSVQIIVVTKKLAHLSNTNLAQGGVACVSLPHKDGFEAHVEDTIMAGSGRCKEDVVEMVVRGAPAGLSDLERWGVTFDKTQTGQHHLALEGGHTQHRIVHCLDATGKNVEQSLLNRVRSCPQITMNENFMVIDLIVAKAKTGKRRCDGLTAYDHSDQTITTILAPIIVLATGGIGHIFKTTTNADVATGDGIGIARRAQMKVEDMHFVQFHPTALAVSNSANLPLISEAVRGAGAILRSTEGHPIMNKIHPLKDLAPRDIVSRSILREMEMHQSKHVYLDCTGIPPSTFSKEFPNIQDACKKHGYNPSIDFLPVVPAAHYSCGGIAVDMHGQTSLDGVLACGENSCTGLHGANRLASNSLSEALVFAKLCSASAVNHLKLFKSGSNKAVSKIRIFYQKPTADEHSYISQSTEKLKNVMSNYAGPFRSNHGLMFAKGRIDKLRKITAKKFEANRFSPEIQSLRNIIETDDLVVEHAMLEVENVGVHYNFDLDPAQIKLNAIV